MHYVYILHSEKDGKLYVGCTKDLKKRISEHNRGYVESTKHRKPFQLVHYEVFLNQEDAFAQEKWLKTGWGKNRMNTMLKKTFESLGS